MEDKSKASISQKLDVTGEERGFVCFTFFILGSSLLMFFSWEIMFLNQYILLCIDGDFPDV